MGVEILYDREAEAAVLYDTTSGFAFGPVLERDAEAKAEAFIAWFTSGAARDTARRQAMVPIGEYDGTDPRHYFETDLAALYSEWKRQALDEDGMLKVAA